MRTVTNFFVTNGVTPVLTNTYTYSFIYKDYTYNCEKKKNEDKDKRTNEKDRYFNIKDI